MKSSRPILRLPGEIPCLGRSMEPVSIPFVTTTPLLQSIRGYKQSSIIVTQFPIMKIYALHIKIFKTSFCLFLGSDSVCRPVWFGACILASVFSRRITSMHRPGTRRGIANKFLPWVIVSDYILYIWPSAQKKAFSS